MYWSEEKNEIENYVPGNHVIRSTWLYWTCNIVSGGEKKEHTDSE